MSMTVRELMNELSAYSGSWDDEIVVAFDGGALAGASFATIQGVGRPESGPLAGKASLDVTDDR